MYHVIAQVAECQMENTSTAISFFKKFATHDCIPKWLQDRSLKQHLIDDFLHHSMIHVTCTGMKPTNRFSVKSGNNPAPQKPLMLHCPTANDDH